MSHDRGCFKCGRDIWEYDRCGDRDCVKKGLVEAMNSISAKVADEWSEKVKAEQNRRPKVYVVQQQTLRDGTPKYDLSPAEDFGELVYVLDETASPFRPGPVWERICDRMSYFQDGDFLLPIGNPVFIGMATAMAASLAPTVGMLVWSSKEQRYIAVTAEMDIHADCI